MDSIGRHLPSTCSTGSLSKTSEPNARPNLCDRSDALKAAIAILGSFRRDDSADPEVFSAACVALFMGYPRDMVAALAHPKTGIAGEQTFMPSIAEIRASLDRRIDADAAKERRQREREEFLRLTAPSAATPEERERGAKRWEEIKSAITGEVTRNAEDERQAAEQRLSALYRESRNPKPLLIGDDLRAKLERMRAGV